MDIPIGLPSFPIQIWGKSFLELWNRDYNFIYIKITVFVFVPIDWMSLVPRSLSSCRQVSLVSGVSRCPSSSTYRFTCLAPGQNLDRTSIKYTLLVYLSVRLYPINVKVAQPIGPKFVWDHKWPQNELQIFESEIFRFLKKFDNAQFFFKYSVQRVLNLEFLYSQ